ncbi:MAG: 50S ribosomal protein L13 [Oligoflexia bacterium]|nr:50S ribosomal protein L13 [Oligoflexia bacterium]
MMKTWNPKTDEMKKNWWLVDATGHPLGRLASEVAILLRGKHKVEFTPHVDTGDFVVIINAKQVHLTGRKWTDKKYFSHSRFFGSLKEKKAKELTETELINKAVSGMLPKNKMRKKLMKKLKVYETAEHPHKAQKPSAYTVSKKVIGSAKTKNNNPEKRKELS